MFSMETAVTPVLPLLINMSYNSFLPQALCIFAIISARHLITAGFVWWLIRGRHIQFDREEIRDLRLSMISAVIFALALALAIQLHANGLTRIYDQPLVYGWWYIVASYLLVLILQDSYFYATHRLFHLSQFYRLSHQGHHKSRRPSPWTSFAFDPVESVVHAFFLVAITCLLPLHLGTILAVLTTMSVWAVVNHLGLDELPCQFPHHWMGRWLIGPAHHSIHHLHQDRHFGLYFTFWDQIMGTEDRKYKQAMIKQKDHGSLE